MREVVVVSASRTPIGNFGGIFKNTSVVDLGSIVVRDILIKLGLKPIGKNFKFSNICEDEESFFIDQNIKLWSDNSIPVKVDEVIIGNVLQAGQGQNTARQVAIKAGLPKETPAFTLNKVCGSGLKAISVGASSIMTGESDIVIAGGMENMSLVPMALQKARWGHRMEVSGKGDILDLLVFDGLYEIFYGYHMGMTAENIASRYKITRKEQDELGVISNTRACDAIDKGFFSEEIVPVKIKNRKSESLVDTDERPKRTTLEKMSELKPVFKKNGTVTAGNSSGINDGSAAVLMMSLDMSKKLGLTPLVKIKSFKSNGIDPAYMGLGPVPAINSVLKSSNMTLKDIEMIELNEAFAVQAIACMRELKISPNKVNKLGSGISLGHPIGCTGARQFVTGLHQMRHEGYNTGLISMCIGGGMGMSMLLEI